MNYSKTGHRLLVGFSVLVVVFIGTRIVASIVKSTPSSPDYRAALDEAEKDYQARQAYITQKLAKYQSAGVLPQDAGFHHSVARDLSGQTSPTSPPWLVPTSSNLTYERSATVDDYYRAPGTTRSISVDPTFGKSLLLSASAAVDAAGTWTVSIQFDADGIAYLSRIVDGGSNSTNSAFLDWACNVIQPGNPTTEMHSYLVSGNKVYLGFSVNDAVVQNKVNTQIVVATGLPQADAQQIVRWLGF